MGVIVYRINWFRVIYDLRRVGFSDVRIAAEIGVSEAAIVKYKAGSEPLHHNGEKLLALHRKHCLSPEPPSRQPVLA